MACSMFSGMFTGGAPLPQPLVHRGASRQTLEPGGDMWDDTRDCQDAVNMLPLTGGMVVAEEAFEAAWV